MEYCKGMTKSEYFRQYREKNADKLRTKKAEYKAANLGLIRSQEKAAYQKRKAKDPIRVREIGRLAAAKFRDRNPLRQKEISAKHRDLNRNKLREVWREYHHQNREKRLAQQREWWLRNGEQRLQKRSNYIAENRELVYAINRNYRARKFNAEGKHSAEDVILLYEVQQGECNGCLRDLGSSFHVDHIMPLLLGGSNDVENLQLLCPTCNCRKGSKHPDTWMREVCHLSS